MEIIYWRDILYLYMFIRVILDFFLNHIFSLFPFVIKSFLVIKSYIVVNLFIISVILVAANYYDLKFGIIPNKLSLILLIHGLIFNLFLSILLNDLLIFFLSLVLTALISLISFILWLIGFWGGGDFKIFIGLSLSLAFLDFNFPFFDYFNDLILKNAIYDFNLPGFSQFIFYPKAFSILLNGIIMAFLSLSLIAMYNILKNKQLKYYSILSFLDFKSFFNQLTTKSIGIGDLSSGMILDKYYFKNKEISNIIDENEESSNLNVRKDEDAFYFSSLNRIGLTEKDVELIKDLYSKNLIKNPNLRIKKGIPFMPFLTLGYLSFLLFGDFISIISSFIRLLF